MLKILLDTDILIDFTKGHKGLLEKLFQKKADAYITATCLSKELILATRNNKHFSKIKQLKFYK